MSGTQQVLCRELFLPCPPSSCLFSFGPPFTVATILIPALGLFTCPCQQPSSNLKEISRPLLKTLCQGAYYRRPPCPQGSGHAHLLSTFLLLNPNHKQLLLWLIPKESTCNCRRPVFPGLGRSPGGGKGYPHSRILAWRVAKSRT